MGKNKAYPRLIHEGGLRSFVNYSILIAGSFNNWDPMIHHLSEDPEGLWKIVIPLPRGRYQYMFVIDRTVWIPDPGSEMTIEDGFGQKNSLLVVE